MLWRQMAKENNLLVLKARHSRTVLAVLTPTFLICELKSSSNSLMMFRSSSYLQSERDLSIAGMYIQSQREVYQSPACIYTADGICTYRKPHSAIPKNVAPLKKKQLCAPLWLAAM